MDRNAEGEIHKFDTFILDTSAVINLHKSNFGDQIIQSLSGRIVITADVKSELDQIASRKYGTFAFLNKILDFENVAFVNLNSAERILSSKLSDRPIIDDGEASVIAVSRYSCAGENCIPIIDEYKGRTVAENCLQGKKCGYSINLFFHPEVLSKLGKVNVSEAVYSALLNARMSIPRYCLRQVVEFIGEKRARNCNSLPGFKNLFP